MVLHFSVFILNIFRFSSVRTHLQTHTHTKHTKHTLSTLCVWARVSFSPSSLFPARHHQSFAGIKQCSGRCPAALCPPPHLGLCWRTFVCLPLPLSLYSGSQTSCGGTILLYCAQDLLLLCFSTHPFQRPAKNKHLRPSHVILLSPPPFLLIRS